MKFSRFAPAVLTCMSALAGCSGSAGSSAAAPTVPSVATAPVAPAADPSVAPGKALLTLTFARPGVATQGLLKTKYVSPATQSVTVGVDGSPTTTASSNCTASGCSVSLSLTPGAHTLAVRLYDAASGGGNELASNTAAACTVGLAVANTCAIPMYGFAASLQMTSTSSNATGSQAAGFTFATNASTPFTIVALDADGNRIVGPGAPVAAATTTSGAIAIATPAPSASPTYGIADSDPSVQTLALSATPAPNSDGAAVSASVSLTGANPYAGALLIVNGTTLTVASPTTGTAITTVPIASASSAFETGTGNVAVVNSALNATLSFYNIATRTQTASVVAACASSDNVPLAADGGRIYYDCGGNVYAYDTTGALKATWADGEGGSSGYVAAGGGNVYTINGTTVSVFTPTGALVRSFPVTAKSPQWAFAANAQGLFISSGTTMRVYSATGTPTATFTTASPGCDMQPNGTNVDVKTFAGTYSVYALPAGTLSGTFTPATSPDCRVGFVN